MHYLDTSVIDLIINGTKAFARMLASVSPSLATDSMGNLLSQPLFFGMVIGVFIALFMKGLLRALVLTAIVALLSGLTISTHAQAVSLTSFSRVM